MTIDALTFVVLALTLGMVSWYTIITRRIQKTAVEQTKELIHQRRLSIMPALVGSIGRKDNLELTNIGNGIAIHIKIDRVEIPFEALRNSYYEFKGVLTLAPKESVSVPYELYVEGSKESEDVTSLLHIREENAKGKVTVKIEFQDIEGNRYAQVHRMGKGGFHYGFVNSLGDE